MSDNRSNAEILDAWFDRIKSACERHQQDPGIFDPQNKVFDFPTPRDPDYYVPLDILEGHESILLEVCAWTDKGVSAKQIVTLLLEAAAVLS